MTSAAATTPPAPHGVQAVTGSLAAAKLSSKPEDVTGLLDALERARKQKGEKRRGSFSVRKTTFDVKSSQDGIQIDSWRLQDWDYKRPGLPTYARGLFTAKTKSGLPEIAVRGYDKFFNVGEVSATKWENIVARTLPPYELTLKENGCIIFIAGLEDETLLVCSKHSTGGRSDVEMSHASAGEIRLEQQLAAIGKTKTDLARELRRRNATAVAELCDDSFEEHILAYGPDKAGLYLHGVNFNLPAFSTYPSPAVQEFADQWGFRKIEVITMDDVRSVKTFLEEAARTGAHDGRDVEGFVIRCKMSVDPATLPYQDWFFKFKFEEPYLMYRQWRECTKALIAGKEPKYKKHRKITGDYLAYARQRLDADPALGELYNRNHGIIAMRDDFLKFKNLKGSDAADMDQREPDIMPEVTRDIILCPIATIGCGKTTIALALTRLFGWGHVQNDDIFGKGRPPRFTKAVLDQLQLLPAAFADRNNANRHEREQIITDLKKAKPEAKIVCLNFRHDEASIGDIRRVTKQRVKLRGDNHQTIRAATDQNKYMGVVDKFLNMFEPCDPDADPDVGFDVVIDLDPLVGSRANLETVVTQLHKYFPNLIKEIPSSGELDAAIDMAIHQYKPKTKPGNQGSGYGREKQRKPWEKKQSNLEYISVDVMKEPVITALQQAFGGADWQTRRFYKQLQDTGRVQSEFHVTLMHRATSNEHPYLWQRYEKMHEAVNGTESKLGECDVVLERVVFDDRVMAIVVQLVDEEGKWECFNRVAHITVGTRDTKIKPKESNNLLALWLDSGVEESRVQVVEFEEKPTVRGQVRAVLSKLPR